MGTQRVLIFDTTLRDGEQSPGATMTTPEKLRMAGQLERLGVDILEAGFPVSAPDDFAAVCQIAREIRAPVIAALARARTGDIDRAAAALEPANRGRIHVFLATSAVHLRHKLKMPESECLDRIATAVAHARRYVDDVEFSPEDATRTDITFLCRAVQVAVEAGATTINIPDTVGYTYPTEYQRIISALRSSVHGIDGVVLSVHCHNDLGLAVANSLCAIENGARQIECTVNGIGERAGNASLEETVMAMRVRGDVLPYETGIRSEEIYPTSRLLTALTGIAPQPNKAIVGDNAFAHEAGIHQDGVLRYEATYEIMRPESVGVPQNRIVLGKHSGRHGVAKRCEELIGTTPDAAVLQAAYDRVIEIAERKEQVSDEDLLAVLSPPVGGPPHQYTLVDLQVTCGGDRSRAVVWVSDAVLPAREARGEGPGPLVATFAALDALLEADMTREAVVIASAAADTEDVVTIRARVHGRSFTGRGTGRDVVRAAAEAYLDVINKATRFGVLTPSTTEDDHAYWAV